MKTLSIYARLYSDCMTQALAGIRKNLWTLLLPMGLLLALIVLGRVFAGLGVFVAGLLLALALDAIASCYLYFLGEVVSKSAATLRELKTSFMAYFWSVMNLFFVFFIARLVLGAVLGGNPSAGPVRLMVELVVVVLLNAAPEAMYLRGTYGGIQTIQASVTFIQQNWIEWFIPNLLMGFFAYVVFDFVAGWPLVGQLLAAPVFGALIHVMMVFRGHLFKALDGSTHRQRLYKYGGGAA
jgi:hypothetical protein